MYDPSGHCFLAFLIATVIVFVPGIIDEHNPGRLNQVGLVVYLRMQHPNLYMRALRWGVLVVLAERLEQLEMEWAL